MKFRITTVLILLTMSSFGQNFKKLNEFEGNDNFPSSKEAVFYGNFIQRLGFSSGGFPQDIRLINLDTKEIFTFRVKPAYKSAKENTFSYHIQPGTYSILNYWWTQSKWYGGKFFTEPIFKGFDAKDLGDKLKSGEIEQSELVRFTFTIAENSLNYLGTWHFDSGIVSFTNDKIEFDGKIKDRYKNLDLSNAKTVLPD